MPDVLSVIDHQLYWIFIVKKFSIVVMIDTLKPRNGRCPTVTVKNQLAPSVWLRLVPVDQRFLVLLISLLWSGRTVAISGPTISTEFLSIRSTWLRLFHHLCPPTHTHSQKKGKFLYGYFANIRSFRMRGANRNGLLLNGERHIISICLFSFFYFLFILLLFPLSWFFFWWRSFWVPSSQIKWLNDEWQVEAKWTSSSLYWVAKDFCEGCLILQNWQNILSLFIDDMRNDEFCMLLEELLLLLMDIQAEAVDHVTLLPHNRT